MIYVEQWALPDDSILVHRSTMLRHVVVDAMIREGAPSGEIDLNSVDEFLEHREYSDGLLGIAQLLIKLPGSTLVLKDHDGKRHTYFGYSEVIELIKDFQ